MATVNLFINTAGNSLIAGLGNPSGVAASSIPLFCPDTGTTLNIWRLAPINPAPASGVFPYSIIAPAGYTYYFYLNDGTVNGTIYASCISFTPDPTGTFFTGQLALNTAALIDLLQGGQNSVTMMTGYVFGGYQDTDLNATVPILAGIPTNAVAPVPAGEAALSQQQAANEYMPQVGLPGQPLTLTSKNGKQIVLQVVDNADGTFKLQESPAA